MHPLHHILICGFTPHIWLHNQMPWTWKNWKQVLAKRFMNMKWLKCKINIKYFMNPRYFWQYSCCMPQPCFWTQSMCTWNCSCHHATQCQWALPGLPRLTVKTQNVFTVFTRFSALGLGRWVRLARTPAIARGPNSDPQHPYKKPIIASGACNPSAMQTWS